MGIQTYNFRLAMAPMLPYDTTRPSHNVSLLPLFASSVPSECTTLGKGPSVLAEKKVKCFTIQTCRHSLRLDRRLQVV